MLSSFDLCCRHVVVLLASPVIMLLSSLVPVIMIMLSFLVPIVMSFFVFVVSLFLPFGLWRHHVVVFLALLLSCFGPPWSLSSCCCPPWSSYRHPIILLGSAIIMFLSSLVLAIIKFLSALVLATYHTVVVLSGAPSSCCLFVHFVSCHRHFVVLRVPCCDYVVFLMAFAIIIWLLLGICYVYSYFVILFGSCYCYFDFLPWFPLSSFWYPPWFLLSSLCYPPWSLLS